MNAKPPLVALSVAAVLLSAQAPYQEAIPAFEAVAMAPDVGNPTFEHKLQFHGQGNDLLIMGGNPGDFCAVVAGFEMTQIPLPGNAMLRVDPLVLVVLGEFDSNYHFELRLTYGGEPIQRASALVQALTVDNNGMFGSSNVGAVDFDGMRNFEFRDVGQ